MLALFIVSFVMCILASIRLGYMLKFVKNHSRRYLTVSMVQFFTMIFSFVPIINTVMMVVSCFLIISFTIMMKREP